MFNLANEEEEFIVNNNNYDFDVEIDLKRARINEKLESIFQLKSKSEVLAIDMEMNILISAAYSYRHESILKPFPNCSFVRLNSSLINNNITSSYAANYKRLLMTLKSIPSVLTWHKKCLTSFNNDQISFLYWLLFEQKRNFKLVPNTSLDQEKLKQNAKYLIDFPQPTHIFDVQYDDAKNEQFENLKAKTVKMLNEQNTDTTAIINESSICSINFHGTKMENVYSILNAGLLSHMNKNSLFGEGTYLSQEPSISLHYSNTSSVWNHSLIGQKLSCVFVCETINDPRHVKTGVNEKNKNNQIPDKYFVVKNNDYVRIKHLLFYAEKTPLK